MKSQHVSQSVDLFLERNDKAVLRCEEVRLWEDATPRSQLVPVEAAARRGGGGGTVVVVAGGSGGSRGGRQWQRADGGRS